MVDGATFVDRQQELRTAMAEAGIDLVASYADVWRPGNVFYLTNWREPAGGISQAWCLFLLPIRGESVLLVGFETTLQAPEIAVMDRVERSDRLGTVLTNVRQTLQPRRVGLIGNNLLPLATFRELATGLGDVEFVDVMPLLTRQRRVKSPAEITLMREAEVAAAGNAFIVSSGAALSFYPMVGSGTNSARVMQLATDKPIRRGELVLLDLALTIKATTATSPGPAAGTEGLKAFKPGVMIKDVELTIRRVITDGGFGDYLLHNIGHGIGTDQEEDFSIGPGSEIELKPSMTFTVKPGIYHPGVGGCRIEDVVVVTDTGVDVPSRVRRDYFLA